MIKAYLFLLLSFFNWIKIVIWFVIHEKSLVIVPNYEIRAYIDFPFLFFLDDKKKKKKHVQLTFPQISDKKFWEFSPAHWLPRYVSQSAVEVLADCWRIEIKTLCAINTLTN